MALRQGTGSNCSRNKNADRKNFCESLITLAHEQTLFVPVSSKEVVTGAFSLNGCCISHGILSALDASQDREDINQNPGNGGTIDGAEICSRPDG